MPTSSTTLSPHFSINELLESQTARRKNIQAQFAPPPQVLQSLRLLCDNILEPLRVAINQPLKISSGYRCSELNTAVGGASNSQHLSGEAADIQGCGLTNAQLFHKIRDMHLPFDQLIWEYGDSNNPAWVHVSFGPRNRRQVLYIGVPHP